MRLDQKASELFQKSRSSCHDLIKRGMITINGNITTKPSTEVNDFDRIELLSQQSFVSRGGEKLSGLLSNLSLSLEGLTGLDVGASTGGFTDCLLQFGIKSMVCVDVGHGQLHESLLNHPLVRNYEGVSILDFKDICNETFDIIVMDVSFTSILNVFDALDSFAHSQTWIILLYKPQFEVGAKFLNKSGLVKNSRQATQVQQHIVQTITSKGYRLHLNVDSTLKGKEGNQETFLVFQKKEGL
jgi:23S rRNA (cytidine1920-2'-O)/16S rRNA (cytidine1409-2'-O)-methyltransferase